MEVLFSVLSYHNSFVTDESINIGILFHDVIDDVRVFETTTNWTRVEKFDDELDIDYLKLILKGIRDEITNESLFNYQEKFNLRKYAKFFVNELKFSDVAIANVESFNDFIIETKKVFLRYDFNKKDRPNHQQQLIYIKNLLKDNDVNYLNDNVKGNFKENINYDYLIDGYAFKLFTFQDKNLNKLILSAKGWSYTAAEMKDIYRTIFMYDIEPDNEFFGPIISILKESAYKVMKIDEAIDFILRIREESMFSKQEKSSIMEIVTN
jgi:hypothetical protein